MDNREDKGSNMMESWRVTSENRLQKKTQSQPVLEAGKMTKEWLYQTSDTLGTHRMTRKDTSTALDFATKRVPEDLDCQGVTSVTGEQCHSLKGKPVTPSLSSFI